MQALHALWAFAFRKVNAVKPNPSNGRAHAHLLKGASSAASSRLPFNLPMLEANRKGKTATKFGVPRARRGRAGFNVDGR